MDRVSSTIYPWNVSLWQRAAAQHVRMPHALLLNGETGLGKQAFALHLAQLMLCNEPRAGEPCDQCRSCHLFETQTHPDFNIVSPLDEGKSIGIDQIRELGEFLSLKPHTSHRRAIVLSPAEAMNVNAANALLKMLEEPPPGNHLLLVTAAPQALPATIRSRCARIDFLPPNTTVATAWLTQQRAVDADADAALTALAAANGAPLRAVALLAAGWREQAQRLRKDADAVLHRSADPLQLAAQWKKIGANTVLEWFQNDLLGRIRTKLSHSGLQAKGERLDLKQLFRFFDLVSRNRALSGDVLDEQLLLEEVLIAWSRMNAQ